jgi:hypothetical protein
MTIEPSTIIQRSHSRPAVAPQQLSGEDVCAKEKKIWQTDEINQTNDVKIYPNPPASLGKIQITQMLFTAFLGAAVALHATGHRYALSSKTLLQTSSAPSLILLARTFLSEETLEEISLSIEKTITNPLSSQSSQKLLKRLHQNQSTQTEPLQQPLHKTELIQMLFTSSLGAGVALYMTNNPEGPSISTLLFEGIIFSAFLQKRNSLSPKQYADLKKWEAAIQHNAREYLYTYLIGALTSGLGIGALYKQLAPTTINTLLGGTAILANVSLIRNALPEEDKADIQKHITNNARAYQIHAVATIGIGILIFLSNNQKK